MKRNKKKRRNAFLLGYKMVRKTFRNYAMLSVTIILSFSFILIYLILSDSNIYNKYKGILGADKNINNITVEYNDESIAKIDAAKIQLEKIPDTKYIFMPGVDVKTSRAQTLYMYYVPSKMWGLFQEGGIGYGYYFERMHIYNIDGTDFNGELGDNEMIVSEAVYRSVNSKDKTMPFVIPLKDQQYVLNRYKIVAYYKSDDKSDVVDGKLVNIEPVYVHGKNLDNIQLCNMKLSIYSKRMKEVCKMLNKLNLSEYDITNQYTETMKEKKNNEKNNYLIAIILYVLLGINLYSAFDNALSERRYEVGVKRAIGASKIDILKQFISEGLIVMLANICLSIIASMNVIIAYKFYKLKINKEIYTVIIDPKSMILFAVIAFSITVIFSLLFAYKSTKTDIIKYIKEE